MDGRYVSKIVISPEVDVILNEVLVLIPLNKKKGTDFVPGTSKNRLRKKA
jgi:hypothetical protein